MTKVSLVRLAPQKWNIWSLELNTIITQLFFTTLSALHALFEKESTNRCKASYFYFDAVDLEGFN